MMGPAAVAFLTSASVGTRVVIRYRIDGGATDAVGELTAKTPDSSTVESHRGPVTIAHALVVAARPVPPAPAPRR